MLCVIRKTIRMNLIELRMFSYNFARIKTKLLFNDKSTNY